MSIENLKTYGTSYLPPALFVGFAGARAPLQSISAPCPHPLVIHRHSAATIVLFLHTCAGHLLSSRSSFPERSQTPLFVMVVENKNTDANRLQTPSPKPTKIPERRSRRKIISIYVSNVRFPHLASTLPLSLAHMPKRLPVSWIAPAAPCCGLLLTK